MMWKRGVEALLFYWPAPVGPSRRVSRGSFGTAPYGTAGLDVGVMEIAR